MTPKIAQVLSKYQFEDVTNHGASLRGSSLTELDVSSD